MHYKWKILNHEIVYQGYFRIERFQLDHEKFDGGDTGPFMRELFERGSAVAVLPYDPVHDKVVLIEQFRIGTVRDRERPWVREVVAGIIEPGESEQDVARRETLEEAGCPILQLEPICRYFVSPGGATERCSLYYGRVDSAGVGGIHGLDDEFEDIRVEVVDFEQAIAWLNSGEIDSATPIIALQWLQLNRDRLRKAALNQHSG